ncbi:tyrosine-type recombinase/integrase [Pseudomaricurvus alcaniphilus]|uniref:integrase domain-containing protein n=1 Tax=Pseudomaricurvus alcaniphilus TaxID=1166482 RepID=UPI00140AC626|nr:integrase domain-containing protein [Pseudomaricurvus alcaniphilus]NHN36895.1 tyrosine-type recombinase/integrase [Pseudomaricurvus alcaniphilus]
MPRTTKPLTNTEVKQAKPKGKEYSLHDGGGLHLRIRPSGAKQWAFSYYTPYTRKRVKIQLGVYPAKTLAQAREDAETARKLLAQDIDPKERQAELRTEQEEAHTNTFEHVAGKWFEVKKSKITVDYADDIWRSFNLHLFPDLRKVPIHKIKAPQTIRILEPIAAKGSLETVKRLCQRINEVMTYAVNTGIIDSNPLAGIGKAFQAPQKRHMPTLKPEQLPELMKALTTASIKLTTRCLIEWQLHTMTRPSEAAGARWDEIDTQTMTWNIPATRMKKKRPHSVPLSPQAMALLQVIKPLSGKSEYIFPADRNWRNHTHPQTANMALKRMGYGGELVSHGLRALASTTLNEQGFDPDITEAALAHVDSNEVRAAYNRADYLRRRRVMMEWWSNHIDEAAIGNMSLSTSRAGLRTAV